MNSHFVLISRGPNLFKSLADSSSDPSESTSDAASNGYSGTERTIYHRVLMFLHHIYQEPGGFRLFVA